MKKLTRPAWVVPAGFHYLFQPSRDVFYGKKERDNQMGDISELLGHTLKLIAIADTDEKIVFVTTDNRWFHMYHDDVCCGSVEIEDVDGYWPDLLGHPILMAATEHKTGPDIAVEDSPHDTFSSTWTFYKLATIKGSLTIRWYGSSNGNYSEKAEFEELEAEFTGLSIGKGKWTVCI